jgi:hypothetical protein
MTSEQKLAEIRRLCENPDDCLADQVLYILNEGIDPGWWA